MGQARATHTNELLGHTPSEHEGDPQYDDAGSADSTFDPGHVQDALWDERAGADRERVCDHAPGQIASGVPSRQRGIAMSGIASEARL